MGGPLRAAGSVQAQLGRDFGGLRFGPRPIDLDIIFYEGEVVQVCCMYAALLSPMLLNCMQSAQR